MLANVILNDLNKPYVFSIKISLVSKEIAIQIVFAYKKDK
ncbi:hypothetical protein HMPREF1232_2186 [Streptococcus pyogenes GA40468]|nr:hypothetical protein HMPREF1232_2186 [Streptococcus pyogenes GA40468]